MWKCFVIKKCKGIYEKICEREIASPSDKQVLINSEEKARKSDREKKEIGECIISVCKLTSTSSLEMMSMGT